jgi:hypothetical protein
VEAIEKYFKKSDEMNARVKTNNLLRNKKKKEENEIHKQFINIKNVIETKRCRNTLNK